MTSLATGPALSDVLARGAVRSVYQPIVDLGTRDVVAYEALARGPEGPMQSPAALFGAAHADGLLVELDAACRAAALSGAEPAGVASPATLFVNVEPEALERADLTALDVALARGAGVPVVLELTERALDSRPADLVRIVREARRLGWRIALDDVGVNPTSLSFMPLLHPDVIKLDMSLVQHRPTAATGAVMNAVNAYAERTGAILLAEGIETEQHLLVAQALGATLGQGWLFGRPGPSVDPSARHRMLALPPAPETLDEQRSPFSCLPTGTPLRRAPKRLLIELSKQLEAQAAQAGPTTVVLAAFQHARHFTAATRRRYCTVAASAGFVAAIGQGLDDCPAPGVRGASIEARDPLTDEWDIVITGPQLHVALLARDLGDTGPEDERVFEYALTYRPETVTAALQALMGRIAPASPVTEA